MGIKFELRKSKLMKNEKGKWVTQTEGCMFCGISQASFLNRIKPKLAHKVSGKKKLYFLPYNQWDKYHKKEFKDEATLFNPDEPENDVDDEAIIDEILNDSEVYQGDDTTKELQKARKREIETRTKYLEQKIIDKKHEIFEEWSLRFYDVFQKAFQKFKNTLIDCHLEEDKLIKLNENLDLALNNLSETLSDIENEYIFNDDNEEDNINN